MDGLECEEWQVGGGNLSSRGLSLLRSGRWTDVTFEVGQNGDIIKAHRLVLASASSVFATMLYGPQAEGNSPIRIPDVTTEIFNLMLEFVYSDRIDTATLERLPDLDYVTKKYAMPRLMQAFAGGLIKNLSPENVVKCYEFAASSEYQPLIEECAKVFSSQTLEVLNAESFPHAKMSTLKYIFSLNRLSTKSELDLLTAAEAYAKANGIPLKADDECQVKCDEQKPSSIRPLLQQIRFLGVPNWHLAAQHQRLRSMLSESKVLLLMLNVTAKEDVAPMPEGFSMFKDCRNLAPASVPALIPIPGKVTAGRHFRIFGVVDEDADRFVINLQDNYSEEQEPSDDDIIVFHISVRFPQNCCVRNSYMGSWGPEELEGDMPFGQGLPFEVVIAIDEDKFNVTVNGELFCEYRHRMLFSQITHLGFTGDVKIDRLSL